MRPTARWILLLACTALGACSTASRQQPSVVLKTEDFIADPATMPTTLPPAAPQAPAARPGDAPPPPATLPLREATAGVRDVIVAPTPTAPLLPAAAAEQPTLIDTKVGEINGRPIRLRDFETEEVRLRSAMLEARRLAAIGDPRGSRENWLAAADSLIRGRLEGILADELLAAEARAALKPEQRLGLRAFIAEATESKRRTLGGSNAELERYLRAENQNQQRFGKELETRVLIQKRIEDVVENRVKASWKDIKRYYQRNLDRFQPPSRAKFRMIVVAQDRADAVQAVQSALEAGEPFEKVAALSANEYNAAEGGLFGDGATIIQGPYEQSEPFALHELNVAARALKPGGFTRTPISRTDREGKVQLTWLFLESLTSRARSLSDPDVQIAIGESLTNDAVRAGRDAYIARLVKRATYNDIDAMVKRLVDIMTERYWPSGT